MPARRTHALAVTLAAAALVLWGAGLPRPALAGTARVAGLAFLPLLDDETDAFLFPGRVWAYQDLIWVDMEAGDAGGAAEGTVGAAGAALSPVSFGLQGSGGLTYGVGGAALGVFVNRPTVLNGPVRVLPGFLPDEVALLRQVAAPSAAFPRPAGPGDLPALSASEFLSGRNVLDVLVGFSPGLGFRLSLDSRNSGAVQPVQEGDDTEQKASSAGASLIQLAGGWSSRPGRGGVAVDASGVLSFTSVEKVENDKTVMDRGFTPSLGATGRLRIPMAAAEFGVVASLLYNHAGVDFPQAEGANLSAGGPALFVGAGPVLDLLADRVVLSGLAGLGYRSVFFEQSNGDSKFEESSFLLPAVVAAVEGRATSWLRLRTGVSFNYQFRSATRTTREGEGENEEEVVREQSLRTRDFFWTAGLDLVAGDLTVEGVLSAPLLTSGPNFLGGKEPGLFGVVSAVYRFGPSRPVAAAAAGGGPEGSPGGASEEGYPPEGGDAGTGPGESRGWSDDGYYP